MGAPPTREEDRRIGLGDAIATVALSLGAALLYAFTLQGRLTGDGVILVRLFHGTEERAGEYYNALFLPLCRLVRLVLRTEDPLAPLYTVSVAGGAIGVGCAYLVCRAFAIRRDASLWTCALLALSPGVWFFSTTVEVHALHMAGTGICALVTLFAPWRRFPVASLAMTAAAFPLLYTTHVVSVLLGPGWVLLVQYARSRKAPPFRWTTLVFGVGPVLLASMIASIAFAYAIRTGSFELTVSNVVRFIEGTQRIQEQAIEVPIPSAPAEDVDPTGEAGAETSSFERRNRPELGALLRRAFLLPFPILLVLVAVGMFSRRASFLQRLTPLALILPGQAFVFVWGFAERGGYFLGASHFLAVLAAIGLRSCSTSRRWLGPVFVAAQAAFGAWDLQRFQRGFENERRVELVRELSGGSGTLLVNHGYAAPIGLFLPEVKEVATVPLIHHAILNGWTPSEWAERFLPILAREPGDAPLLMDTSRPYLFDRLPRPYVEPYLQALEKELRARFRVTDHRAGAWKCLVIDGPLAR